MSTTVQLDHCVSDIVRQLLVDLSVGSMPTASLIEEWPVFTIKEPDKPDDCITIYDTEGVLDGRFFDNGEWMEHYGVMIGVRSPKYTNPYKSKKAGYDKAKQIRNALNTQVNQTTVTVQEELGTNQTVYLVHSAEQAGSINSLGQARDNSERYLFTLNYLFTITQEV